MTKDKWRTFDNYRDATRFAKSIGMTHCRLGDIYIVPLRPMSMLFYNSQGGSTPYDEKCRPGLRQKVRFTRSEETTPARCRKTKRTHRRWYFPIFENCE